MSVNQPVFIFTTQLLLEYYVQKWCFLPYNDLFTVITPSFLILLTEIIEIGRIIYMENTL